jgi:hypothetical protein
MRDVQVRNSSIHVRPQRMARNQIPAIGKRTLGSEACPIFNLCYH